MSGALRFDRDDRAIWLDAEYRLHRDNGPAVEFKDSEKQIWALEGKTMTKEEFDAALPKFKERMRRNIKREYQTGLDKDIKVRRRPFELKP